MIKWLHLGLQTHNPAGLLHYVFDWGRGSHGVLGMLLSSRNSSQIIIAFTALIMLDWF